MRVSNFYHVSYMKEADGYVTRSSAEDADYVEIAYQPGYSSYYTFRFDMTSKGKYERTRFESFLEKIFEHGRADKAAEVRNALGLS